MNRARPGAPRRVELPLAALGVVLVVGAGLVGAMLVSSAGQRSPVLVAARDIPAGSRVDAADVRVAELGVPPGVAVVAASARSRVVGRVAAVAIPRGAVLSGAQVSSSSPVARGEAVVGVVVPPGVEPTADLRVGDWVSVIRVAGSAGSDAPVPAGLATARVYGVRRQAVDQGGGLAVSLLVAAPRAASVADAAASERVRLVLLSAADRHSLDDRPTPAPGAGR
ncbi:MAG: flagella basal body P-ring formation protein FlgA [Actinobacteria bacterium]|nr:flagella basal body P-ring formation protein FlgA [Actinomycetota bacterium]